MGHRRQRCTPILALPSNPQPPRAPRPSPPPTAQELLPSPPYPLLWLRYSTFIPLYPLGVASELSMVWLAWPTLRRTHLWSVDMPNAYNFAFDYSLACLVIVAAYLPGERADWTGGGRG